ncbi:MAG TPA: M90 family metallopeptidase [Noviherbaspirillum sp.]|nr:M90 family metallopeptidase [Noviherbaspirillum sp.]
MQWIRHLLARNKPQIPESLWRHCFARLSFMQRLSLQERSLLKSLCETLLDKKTFSGVAGFPLDDEIAVLIAAQASLPVLHLTLDLYDDMAGVIVYPSAFVLPQSETDEAGVVHEWHEPVSGEAVDAGGAVVLSWEDVQAYDAPGYNLVIHEFVHKIDMHSGTANGCPPFLPEYHKELDPKAWQLVFSTAYADFTHRVEQLEALLPENFTLDNEADDALYDELCRALPLDPYAARHPAEFFAVASEAFFVLPQPLSQIYPEVYQLLKIYYRQDPLVA